MDDDVEQHRRFERQLGSALRTVVSEAQQRERALVAERDRARADAERAAAETQRATAGAARAQAKLEELYASETWRVGAAVLALPKRVRDALRR